MIGILYIKKNMSFMCVIGINELKELYICVILFFDDCCLVWNNLNGERYFSIIWNLIFKVVCRFIVVIIGILMWKVVCFSKF